MSFHRFLVGLLLMGLGGVAIADEIELNPSRDTSLFEESNTLSNGSGDFIFTGNTRGRLGASFRRALLGFDLSDVPAGATIETVTLSMTVTKSVSNDHDFGLHKLLSDWGEAGSDASGAEGRGTQALAGDATWSHAELPDKEWTTPGGDFVELASAVTAVARASRVPYSWSSPGLVADVQSWIDNPAENFGWILIGAEDVSGSAKRFNSRENGTNPPKLTVEFSVNQGLLGDFNGNMDLDIDDINMLVRESASGANNSEFDLNTDGLVDRTDVTIWAKDLKNTWIGDANLDNEFGSGDLVDVFQAGKFETDQDANWAEGDWTGDHRFGTGDLVAGFQDGGFEMGPRVAAVPEPSSFVLWAFLGFVIHRIRRHS